MSNFPTPYEQRYTQALHHYEAALDRGEIETVAAILRDAEQDSHLEQLLLNANRLYQRKNSITVSRIEVKQAQALLLTTFASHESEEFQEDTHMYSSEKLPVPVNSHISTQKGRMTSMSDTIVSKPRKPRGTTRRLHRISGYIQTLAAVLIVGLLISGFALLFASRHNTTTGSGTPSSGHATPSHSILVTSTEDGTIYGTRPDTGEVIWHYSIGKSIVNDFSALTMNGQVVYFAAKDQLYALRVTNGTLLWHKSLPVPKSELTNYNKIVVDQGVVFLSGQAYGVGLPGGVLYALRERDGAILWQYMSGPNSLLAEHNGVVYAERVLDDQGNLAIQALRGRDGKYLWHYDTQVISVVADDTTLYVYAAHPLNVPGEIPGSKKQDKTLLALNTNGVLLWSRPVASNSARPIIMAQGVIIMGQMGEDVNAQQLCAYQIKNGSQMWCMQNGTQNAPADLSLYVVMNNTVYANYSTSFTADTGRIDARNLSDGTLRWSTSSLSKHGLDSLVATDKTVYVLTDHKVYALDAANGHVHWQLSNSASTFTSLAVGSW